MPRRPKTPHLFTVEDRGYETPCWIWTRAFCTAGAYGHVRRGKRNILAHRWIYELLKGPIPKGKQIHHRCEQTLCVNADHLEPVTGTENTRRGRRTKLALEQVEEIRRRLAAGETPSAALAAEYGVRTLHIWRIQNDLTWVAS